MRIPDHLQRLLSIAAAVLLIALAATAALTEGHGFAGWARPAGVLVGGLLAVRRVPFPAVVIAATATTALLRLCGVS
ncbi:AzlD domain-containing protein [Actinomadura sp. HBU206391]|uniref:AzlD domain-containing protein n=1 Tax=Actinomadura sp. HBU206391 TaxID=2731692 RepID=UPI00164F3BD4|nr:AzlD domain-containing protein [Actinomadura sp. HBU206391]MBC6457277.1 AzlD domain-containing protein [Actinomadura sp. HBU206391]